jgi:hypothetical protein
VKDGHDNSKHISQIQCNLPYFSYELFDVEKCTLKV